VNEILLSDASFSEVLARVSYRCIRYYHRYYTPTEIDPEPVLFGCADWLRLNGFTILSTWAYGYWFQWTPITPLRSVRDGFMLRARRGYSWRHTVYPSYKNARRDPRVTNRGVTRRSPTGEK